MGDANVPKYIPNEEWQSYLNELSISGAKLLAEGIGSGCRRVYEYRGKIYKIAAFRGSEVDRKNNLREEFDFIKDCEVIRAVPHAYSYGCTKKYEYAVYERIEGEILSDLPAGILRKIPVMARLALALIRISIRRISHNDLYPDNIIVTPKGNVAVIDFDQATRDSIGMSMYRNLCSTKSAVVNMSFIRLVVYLIVRRPRRSNLER